MDVTDHFVFLMTLVSERCSSFTRKDENTGFSKRGIGIIRKLGQRRVKLSGLIMGDIKLT